MKPRPLAEIYHHLTNNALLLSTHNIAMLTAEIAAHMMMPRPMVLYYPPGESMWNGQVRPNAEVAREFLLAIRSGTTDVALPAGWELKPVEPVSGDVIDVKEQS